ncbi:PepSY-associated TM helix domain-containing protein [Paraflavitalea pollutisoli]|uniref:PepSY-associated TM helix domain-containing protein n=1 Tax=Paraflavitalea pollutisoli TaxID=3034143 RepID=UPI0023EC75A7|nr:PepSY-associated TM helix domain-containing protein [Paraflavitalea sp. H1-2-19X]
MAGFMPGVVDFPKAHKPVIKLKGNTPESSRLTGGKFDTEIQISARDYTIEKIITANTRSVAQKADKLMSEIHYGMYGGIAMQVLYAFCGIGTGLLSITGFILWYNEK